MIANRHLLIITATVALAFTAGCSKPDTTPDRGAGTSTARQEPDPQNRSTGSIDDSTMADMAAQRPQAGAADDGVVIGPSGNGETLPPIAVSTFLTNTATTGCFPASDGWDRYYPLPRLLIGPFTTTTMLTFTNIFNLNSASVSTLNLGNPPGLETAIVIYPEFAPTDRTCTNNVGGQEKCLRTPTVAGIRYKATVFYKSRTLPTGTTSVLVRWEYP